jgi:hypothetical protein
VSVNVNVNGDSDGDEDGVPSRESVMWISACTSSVSGPSKVEGEGVGRREIGTS